MSSWKCIPWVTPPILGSQSSVVPSSLLWSPSKTKNRKSSKLLTFPSYLSSLPTLKNSTTTFSIFKKAFSNSIKPPLKHKDSNLRSRTFYKILESKKLKANSKLWNEKKSRKMNACKSWTKLKVGRKDQEPNCFWTIKKWFDKNYCRKSQKN